MSAVQTPIPAPAAATSSNDFVSAPTTHIAGVADAKADLLARVLDLLDRDGLACCVLQNYEDLATRVDGDVDLLVPREMLPRRLAELLRANAALLGVRIVQWFEDRAHFIVLHAKDKTEADGSPVMLQLHLSRDTEVADRVIFAGDHVLRSRRRSPHGRGRMWIPAPHVEFASVLANRIDKGKLEERHTRKLSELWAMDPLKCSEQTSRLFPQESAIEVASAAGRNAWGHVLTLVPTLRREMRVRLAGLQPLSFLTRFTGRQLRRVRRWTSRAHTGLHVVFLGPDGVGKSTTIDTVRGRIAPAFLHNEYQTFARSLLANKPKASPHALPPRSLPESLLKVLWWLNCYTLGYYRSVFPTLTRGGLVINHRYLLDAIVDPRRYRYSGPIKLLRAIWAVAPKPDLVIFLDAPADIIWARKKETTLEETTRQRDAYLALAATIPNGRVVSTNQGVEKTIDEVTEILLDHMAAKIARRRSLK